MLDSDISSLNLHRKPPNFIFTYLTCKSELGRYNLGSQFPFWKLVHTLIKTLNLFKKDRENSLDNAIPCFMNDYDDLTPFNM